jgi:hypothetical protein
MVWNAWSWLAKWAPPYYTCHKWCVVLPLASQMGECSNMPQMVLQFLGMINQVGLVYSIWTEAPAKTARISIAFKKIIDAT